MFCGFCVEACPCDAIRMDTGRYDITGFDRKSFIVNREQLLGEQHMPGASDANVPRTLPGVPATRTAYHAH